MAGTETWTEADWEAFYELANAHVHAANDLIDVEPAEDIAAAMIYACARFNTFVMQAQMEDPSTIQDETVGYLGTDFQNHMLEHIAELQSTTPATAGSPIGRATRAVEILDALDGRDEDDVSEFLDLADKFLDIANGQIGKARLGRVSAAFMHAATRFNVFAIQKLGHLPKETDRALVSAFRDIYEKLVRYHAKETLIEPQA